MEEDFDFLRMLVSCRAIVAMVDPEYGDVGLRLRGKVKDNGLVGTEVCGDDGIAVGFLCEGDGPTGDLKRGLASQFLIPGCDLLGGEGR